MKIRPMIVVGWIPALLFVLAAAALARSGSASAVNTAVAHNTADEAAAMRVEGEKRFHTNCGRCHAAPQKFPPRMMATIVRHMRVRATITDEDTRLVLYYLTQ